jgi:hypothetical protein
LKAFGPLENAPTEIEPALTRWQEARFLDRVLADIGDQKITRLAIETEPPRIAQTVRPDFGPGALLLDEWVVLGDAVRKVVRRRVDINPQDRAKQGAQVLTVPFGIATGATVAETDVQVAVRSKEEQTAVVIGVRLLDGQNRFG